MVAIARTRHRHTNAEEQAMITAGERKAAFMADLQELLTKHGAEIMSACDYDMANASIEVSMARVLDGSECVKESCEFEFQWGNSHGTN